MELSTGEIIAAIVGLVGFIATLLKVIHSFHVETKTEMKLIKDRHFKQQDELLDLTGKVGKLEGEREGFMLGVDKAITDVSANVIDAIREIKND